MDSLRKILEVERDEFWSWHWTFRSARLKKPQPLLGDARVTDLAVNVILPWLWTRAAEGKNEKLQRVIEHRYAVWPQAEDNSILKLVRQRLLGVGWSRRIAERFRAAGVDSNHARLLRTLECCLRELPLPGTGARLESPVNNGKDGKWDLVNDRGEPWPWPDLSPPGGSCTAIPFAGVCVGQGN